MNDDYGYFGRGLTGYVHYTEALKDIHGGGGGGGGKGSGGGWTRVFLILLILNVLYILFGEACN